MSVDTPTDKNAIAFIDPRVADYQELIKTFHPSVEVVVLDAERDGVQQIADWLEGRGNVEAVHIISHGAAASIRLGSSELSASTIASYELQFASIGAALSADADILIYGCDVASGQEGQAFVERLATLTGADVGASANRTGSSFLGGDANLEFTFGDVSATSTIAQSTFDGFDLLLLTSPWAKGHVAPSPISSPIQPGTQISLSTLFEYSPDTTSFDVRVRTNAGGYLIDPSGQIINDHKIHTGNIQQISQWKFVASTTSDRSELIGFDAINASAGLSNATSVVLTGSNIIQGIDWPFTISFADALSVRNEGYQFVIRYYHNDGSILHNLTSSERVDLENANLKIAVVWENKAQQQALGIGAFSDGTSDANAAISLAEAAGQQSGSAIYFAVDLNVNSIGTIETYFSQVNSVFDSFTINDHHYKVGVYGSGFVASTLVNDGYVDYTWLAQAAYNWQGTSSYNSWNIAQVGTTDSLTVPMSNVDPNSRIQAGNLLGVDIDVAKGDFGAFGAGSTSLPDLTISNVTVSPGSVIAGGNVTVGFDVNNIGDAPAGASAAWVYLSTDPTITPDDTRLWFIDTSSFIGALGHEHLQGVFTIPPGTPAGTPYRCHAAACPDNPSLPSVLRPLSQVHRRTLEPLRQAIAAARRR
ncbi:MAG: DUF4347 domain-containing protein [Xanthobacteraceae bacterium]